MERRIAGGELPGIQLGRMDQADAVLDVHTVFGLGALTALGYALAPPDTLQA